jgi:hypothetical protein
VAAAADARIRLARMEVIYTNTEQRVELNMGSRQNERKRTLKVPCTDSETRYVDNGSVPSIVL